MKEQLIADIKAQREAFDLLEKQGKTLNLNREVSAFKTSLQLGRNWMGKLMGALGNEYPYKESFNPANKIIEERTDVTKETMDWPENYTQTEKVKWLREQLKHRIEYFKKILMSRYPMVNQPSTRSMGVVVFSTYHYDDGVRALNNIITHLEEANMWLGWELNNIKEKLDNAVDSMVRSWAPGTGSIISTVKGPDGIQFFNDPIGETGLDENKLGNSLNIGTGSEEDENAGNAEWAYDDEEKSDSQLGNLIEEGLQSGTASREEVQNILDAGATAEKPKITTSNNKVSSGTTKKRDKK